MNDFINAYIEAIRFTDFGGDSEIPADAEFAPATKARIGRDCLAFYHKCKPLIEGREEQAGHDFWLTRQGHGAGFWDGDWPEPAAAALTQESHRFGAFELYLGDDEFVRHQ